jgi:hypothetical protein
MPSRVSKLLAVAELLQCVRRVLDEDDDFLCGRILHPPTDHDVAEGRSNRGSLEEQLVLRDGPVRVRLVHDRRQPSPSSSHGRFSCCKEPFRGDEILGGLVAQLAREAAIL